jgi:protein-S-isoprenylcysteine O-methyltransferase Ste14
MNPIEVFGACAAGVAVGFILGLIIFVIFADADKSKRWKRPYQFLGTFAGLGGGSGVGFGFLGIKLLPIYIGVASLVLVFVALTALYLRWRKAI